jgi:hypothetical protein
LYAWEQQLVEVCSHLRWGERHLVFQPPLQQGEKRAHDCLRCDSYRQIMDRLPLDQAEMVFDLFCQAFFHRGPDQINGLTTHQRAIQHILFLQMLKDPQAGKDELPVGGVTGTVVPQDLNHAFHLTCQQIILIPIMAVKSRATNVGAVKNSLHSQLGIAMLMEQRNQRLCQQAMCPL